MENAPDMRTVLQRLFEGNYAEVLDVKQLPERSRKILHSKSYTVVAVRSPRTTLRECFGGSDDGERAITVAWRAAEAQAFGDRQDIPWKETRSHSVDVDYAYYIVRQSDVPSQYLASDDMDVSQNDNDGYPLEEGILGLVVMNTMTMPAAFEAGGPLVTTDQRIGFIHGLVLNNELQGHGLSVALLARMRDFCCSDARPGYDFMALKTQNMVAAMVFCKAMGGENFVHPVGQSRDEVMVNVATTIAIKNGGAGNYDVEKGILRGHYGRRLNSAPSQTPSESCTQGSVQGFFADVNVDLGDAVILVSRCIKHDGLTLEETLRLQRRREYDRAIMRGPTPGTEFRPPINLPSESDAYTAAASATGGTTTVANTRELNTGSQFWDG
eukprot:Clim_evm16s3 gene=Clim_evmTU16s3